MGNRHGHKQLRRAVRARMAITGESYQQAHAQILALRPVRQTTTRTTAPRAPTARTATVRAPAPRAAGGDVDLLSIHYFGVPGTLATFELAGRLAILVLPSPRRPVPFPLHPLIALGSRRSVH
jgi:hypothetical protein